MWHRLTPFGTVWHQGFGDVQKFWGSPFIMGGNSKQGGAFLVWRIGGGWWRKKHAWPKKFSPSGASPKFPRRQKPNDIKAYLHHLQHLDVHQHVALRLHHARWLEAFGRLRLSALAVHRSKPECERRSGFRSG